MRSIMKVSGARFGLAALALGSILVAASLSSCNNDYPIYGSIQQEKPGATEGPFFKAVVGEIVKVGNNYFAQRANIAQSTDGSTWTSVGIGGLGTTYSCTSLAATSTAAWAVVDGHGLFSSVDGTTWTEPLADPTGDPASSPMIDNVFVANGVVFVESHNENGTLATTTAGSTDDVYTLSASSDGTSFSAVTFSSGGGATSSTPFAGAAFADGYYWIIAKDGLYSSTSYNGPFALVSETGAPPAGAAIDSIIASTSVPTTIYVGTDAAAVYMRTTGGTWSSVPSSLTYPVTALVEIPATSTSTVILAGLGANASTTSNSAIYYGYVQLDPSTLGITAGGNSIVVPNSTNYDTTLSGKPVNAFLYDATNKILFAGTTSAGIAGASGLWTTTWGGTAWSSGGWSPIN